jgi:two-component sensor histidine kinase
LAQLNTTLQHTNQELKAFSREKEVLLKEVHHRVKNNLQVISSLLSLQVGVVTDPNVLQVFRESQHRVRAMALIHEKLYQSRDLGKVDFGEYVRSLTGYLFRSFGVERATIALTVNVKDVFLEVEKAIPCGLIVNELVSNALKHAFPAGREGEIRIDAQAKGTEHVTLRVSDNGVGFPPAVDVRTTTSLGLGLVNTLTKQLEGTIEQQSSGGTTFQIRFSAS